MSEICWFLWRRSDCRLVVVMSLLKVYESSSLFWDAISCQCCLAGWAGMRGTGAIMASHMSGLCNFCTAFARDASSSFRWMRGGLLGMRRGAQKGPRKSCNCPKSDAFLVIGFLTREKKGKKGAKKNASMGMHHFCAKIGENGGAAGARFRADPGRKIDAANGVVRGWRCIIFVQVL